jgi:hypothetical protein
MNLVLDILSLLYLLDTQDRLRKARHMFADETAFLEWR